MGITLLPQSRAIIRAGLLVVCSGTYGQFVLLPSADTRLLQLDLTTTKVRGELKGVGDWALSAAEHPESRQIAAGLFGGEICVWNADDAELLQSWVASPSIGGMRRAARYNQAMSGK